MLSLDDIQFLKALTSNDAGYVKDYFIKEVSATVQDDGADLVLNAYMAFLGRTVIRNGFSVLAIDPSDTRPFEVMIAGSNPAHNFYGVVPAPHRPNASLLLDRLQRERRSDCALYRMSLSEALGAKLLRPADLIVFTNIHDPATAYGDLRTVSQSVARPLARVVLHGAHDAVTSLVDRLSDEDASPEWEFLHSAADGGTMRFVSLRIKASSEPMDRGAVGTRLELVGFDALGDPVDAAELTRHEDRYAEILPAGSIPNTASEASQDASDAKRPHLHYDAFRCAHFRGARLIGHSGVLDRNGRLFSGSLCAQKEMVREGHYWEIPYIAPHKDGGYHVNVAAVGQHCYRKALLLTQAWEENYQHWLFEILPQVTAAWQAGVDTVIVSSDIRRYQRRALELLGFSGDRVVTHDLTHTMYCDSLLAGSFTAFNMGWVHPEAFAVYDRLVEATRETATIESPELVYISRSDAEWKRRLLNEAELIERLSRLGFVAINPGALDFDNEVQVLSKAKIIVGAVGAGMSNMVFAPPGIDVIAIQSPSFGMTSRFFPMVASIRSQRWHSIMSVALNPTANDVAVGQNDNINIIVDIDAVAAKVEKLLENMA
ncbi:glycosyltransferase family 61 protein [Azospirillum himalayense]|uniref:Glycosyltransferase family 61 protein n=1 Tax=Azospirillum himalayense TaxID=654847 RepID=A0ABW0G3H1_9PROT